MNKTKILLLLLLASCFSKEKDKLINTRSKVETADIDEKDEDGFTKLHWAVMRGDEVKVKEILYTDASLEIKDNFGKTALYLAARNGHNKIALLLLNRGAKIVNYTCQEMLFKLAENKKDIELAVRLLELSKRLFSDTNKPLHLAAEQDRLEILNLLLEKEVAEKMNKMTGHFEKREGEAEATSIANEVDENGRTALHISAMNGGSSSIIIKLFCYIKIYLGKDASFKYLLAKDKNGNTALHCAIINRQLVSTKELIFRIKRIPNAFDLSNNDSETALHLAVRTGNKEVVELLLEAGANIDIGTAIYPWVEGRRTLTGLTPLHIAIITQQPEMFEFLLERGANPNVKDTCDGYSLISLIPSFCFKNLELMKRNLMLAQALFEVKKLTKKFVESELAEDPELGREISEKLKKFIFLTRDLRILNYGRVRELKGAIQEFENSFFGIEEFKVQEILQKLKDAECIIRNKIGSDFYLRGSSSELQLPPAKVQRVK